MISAHTNSDFSQLLTNNKATTLLARLTTLKSTKLTVEALSINQLSQLQQQWWQLTTIGLNSDKNNNTDQNYEDNPNENHTEQATTDWLIALFNMLFAEQQVTLVRGNYEPEYFPVKDNQFARIEFAHGFFASALHEISHWCIASKKRRLLSDFGYWYAPDGRSAAQQQAFERVEVKPQALECLFTLACKRPFLVSQDNLFADFDTSNSTFSEDVYQQAAYYIAAPQFLPRDAQKLLWALLTLCVAQ